MSLKLGINGDVSNKDYHDDREYISSSGLKLLLKDPKEFHKKYILGEAENKNSSAFEEGSYAHSLILEPEKVESEYRFFEGFRKAGKEWEQFKEDNKGFQILSKAQKIRTEELVEAYHRMPVAKKLIEPCQSELTCCVEIDGVKIKVRADAINIDAGYIADVKTTGYASDATSFANTCKQFGYELSGALYCLAFSQVLNKNLDFYFVVLSKQDQTCDVYKLSRDSMNSGVEQVRKAIQLYKHYTQNGWKIEETQLQKVINELEYEIKEV